MSWVTRLIRSFEGCASKKGTGRRRICLQISSRRRRETFALAAAKINWLTEVIHACPETTAITVQISAGFRAAVHDLPGIGGKKQIQLACCHRQKRIDQDIKPGKSGLKQQMEKWFPDKSFHRSGLLSSDGS